MPHRLSEEDESEKSTEARTKRKHKRKAWVTMQIMFESMLRLAVDTLELVIRVFSVIFNAIPMIQPEYPMLLLWNLFFLAAVIILLFFTPMQSAFQMVILSDHEKLNLAAIFAMDVLIKLNTGYFKDGEVVCTRTKVVRKCLTHMAIWLNFASIFTLYLGRLYRLFFLFNVFTVSQIVEQFDQHFQIKQRFYFAFEVIKLFFIVAFIASTFGSIFYLISNLQVADPPTSSVLSHPPSV